MLLPLVLWYGRVELKGFFFSWSIKNFFLEYWPNTVCDILSFVMAPKQPHTQREGLSYSCSLVQLKVEESEGQGGGLRCRLWSQVDVLWLALETRWRKGIWGAGKGYLNTRIRCQYRLECRIFKNKHGTSLSYKKRKKNCHYCLSLIFI